MSGGNARKDVDVRNYSGEAWVYVEKAFGPYKAGDAFQLNVRDGRLLTFYGSEEIPRDRVRVFNFTITF